MDRGALTGLVLAGGRGQRMGGADKGLVEFAGAPLVSWAIGCLRPHVGQVLISANRHLTQYAALADAVVEDAETGFQGPLMGIYSGLRAADTEWVVILPCDSPLLPDDLVARLARVAEAGADIAVADDGQRRHPVVAMIRQALYRDLGRALASGERKVGSWYACHECLPVDVSDCAEAFANLNSDAERIELESCLRRQDDDFD